MHTIDPTLRSALASGSFDFFASLANAGSDSHARLTLTSPASRPQTEKASRTDVISNIPTENIGRLFKNSGYDVTIFNMSPSLDVLHVSALIARDWIPIPTKLVAMAVDGVNEVLRSIWKLLRASIGVGTASSPHSSTAQRDKRSWSSRSLFRLSTAMSSHPSRRTQRRVKLLHLA